MRITHTIFLSITIVILQSVMQCATAAAGRTEGHPGVSPTGAAQYSIPIWVPPGIRGVQPKLAIRYDSHAPVGMMGRGWFLEGMSVIARCNRTYAQDGSPGPVTLTTSDAFCLDGVRLRSTGTGTYQTEIANFATVSSSGTAGNGPASFTAKGKDGLTYEYGGTTDSRVLAAGSTTAYVWALNKVTDRNGNYMTLTYYQAGGGYVPLTIKYTATTSSATFPYQVSFTYSSKATNDIRTTFLAGTKIQETQQLSAITTTLTSSGAVARKYSLGYTYSTATARATLTSIQECGGSTGTDCLAATSIQYQNGSQGVAAASSSTGSGPTAGTLRTADLNGDGRMDLLYAVQSGSNLQWWAQIATATGFGTPISIGATTANEITLLVDDFDTNGSADVLAPNGAVWYVYKFNGTAFVGTSTGISVSTPGIYSSADFDGDGKPDLIRVASGSTAGTVDIAIQLNTSTATSTSFAATPVVRNINLVSPTALTFQGVYGNNRLTNSTVKKMDFDGDGRDDLLLSIVVRVNKEAHYIFVPILSRGTATPSVGAAFGNVNVAPTTVAAVNWNDDRCTDLVVDAAVQTSPCSSIDFAVISLAAIPKLLVDWDGDGRTDSLYNSGGTWMWQRSQGTTVAAAVSTGLTVGAGNYIVLDQDGDGLDDWVLANSSSSNALYLGRHNGSPTKPDLATSFVDGFGIAFQPIYKPLLLANYTKLSTAVYPKQDYIGSMSVVTNTSASDGVGGTYSLAYYYYQGVRDLQGRGFLGFYSVRENDSRFGTYNYRYYSQDFPYIGMLKEDDFVQPDNSKYIQVLKYTLNAAVLDSTAFNQRYFPYTRSVTASRYEYGGTKNGLLMSTVAVEYGVPDTYGNFTNIVRTTTDNDTGSPFQSIQWKSAVGKTITPNTSTWCLDLPTQLTITNSSTASSGAAITRTISYSPDYTYCRESATTVEPNSAKYKVTEAYEFDGFGNITKTTTSGIGMADRVGKVGWTTSGQFPTSATNPLGQAIGLVFDGLTGQISSQVDANSTTTNVLTTTWQYDGFGRLIQRKELDGTYTTWTFSDCASAGGCIVGTHGLVIVKATYKSDGSLLRTETEYRDSLDRPLAVKSILESGSYSRNEVRYDSAGRVVKQYMPCTWTAVSTVCPYYASAAYDILNRPYQVQRPISASNTAPQTTSIVYSGDTVSITDPLAAVTNRTYYAIGDLGRSQDPAGYYQQFYYDSFGSLVSVSDSASNNLYTAVYDYGVDAFRVKEGDMDRGTRTYTIDALGEAVGSVDAKGQSFSNTFDALSRPLTRVEPGLSTTWVWGNSAASFNIGRLQSVSSVSSEGTYQESYGYDLRTRLRVKTYTLPGDAPYTFNMTYNATSGLLDTLEYPTSTSSYKLKLQYNYSNGILGSISNFANSAQVFWTASAVNGRGQVSQETLGNGVVVNRSYDAVTGWLATNQAGVGGGATLANESYAFDLIGNLVQRQNNNLGLTENFYYDSDYRLDHSTLNGVQNLKLTYDSQGLGNIASRSDVASGSTWTYDSVRKHAVTQAGAGGPSFTYDNNGNAATRGGYPIVWSSYNYPTSIAAAGESIQFSYGSFRNRWKTVYNGSIGTEYTYSPGRLMEKVVNGSSTDYRHYIFVGDRLVAVYSRTSTGTNAFKYMLEDHQGSIAHVLADSSPGPVSNIVSENFGAFGLRRNGSTWAGAPVAGDTNLINGVSRRGYTSETSLGVSMGLNHLNGRVQDAITGRFLSADPEVSDVENTQGFNRYSYVNNNPLTFTDHSGFDLDPITVVASLGGPENPYADLAGILVGIADVLGLGGAFGGAALPPSQALAQAHGVDLNQQLPEQTVVGHLGAQFDVTPIAMSLHAPFAVKAIADTAGVDPDMVRGERVTISPSQSAEELDHIEVSANIDRGFNGWNLVPGYNLIVCAYFGCGGKDWTLAGLAVLPGGAEEAAVARGLAGPTRTVIGKLADLKSLGQGERSLLSRLPNLGSPKANWAQNSGVLRQEMRLGQPIRDASVDAAGRLINNTGFLRAERNLLESRGWSFDPATTLWSPPVP